MNVIDPDEFQHEEQQRFSRFHQRGTLIESPGWPRVGIVGVPGRMIEVSTDHKVEHIVFTVLGGDALSGAGVSPAEARELIAALELAIRNVEARHGRQE